MGVCPTSPHVLCGSGEGIRPCSLVVFCDDVVLMVHQARTFSMYWERFAAECEAAGMRISTSKSEAMVLDRKRWRALSGIRSYVVGVPDRRGAEGAESKGEALDLPVNPRSIHLTYGHELWVMTERTRFADTSGRNEFPPQGDWGSLRDRVRSSVTREELGVEPLLLHIERSQLRWLGHLFQMPPGHSPP
ncbi:hypothetical protein L3Q82_011495 [Scortum barcoo]|uniref:Uncharacterized protein n=1 Tax=Scortum barcoo TaxID=214431 RepID=A0ACB8W4V9_9TELE|nr:hypothetical protein L3Q82_011495 [Scortum barcoo]